MRIPSSHSFQVGRSALIASSVVVFHVAVLWAMQSGLLRRAVEIVVPAFILSEIVEPPKPRVEPPPPAKPPPAREPPRKAAPPTPPRPMAVAEAAPSPDAPLGAVEPQPSAPPIAAPVASAAAPQAAAPAPAPATVELPSSDADYLQNPTPAYPATSRRLGEQGRTIVRVQIGADGSAQRAEIRSSSGFARLDQAALQTVMKWRYVPGKRGGVPEAMWFNVPINFVLE